MRHKALIFLSLIFLSFPILATTNGWYLGAGVMAVRGQSVINSTGVANNTIPIVVPSYYNKDTHQEFVFPGSFIVQNNYHTGVASTNAGINGLIGYTLPFFKVIGLGVQMDATINSGRGHFFKQYTISPDSPIINQPLNVYFKAREKYLRSYGISLLPQWHFYQKGADPNDWQASLLLLLGYRYGIFKATWEALGPFTGMTSYASQTGRNGFEIGVGTQISLTRHMDIRFIVSQTRYPYQTIFSQPNIGWSAKSQSMANQATLGMIWVI